MTPPIDPDPHLRGRWLMLARLAWAGTTLTVLGLFVASQPYIVAQVVSAESDYTRFGFTRPLALIYFLTLNAAPLLSFTAAAGVIFLRRSADRFVLLVSLMLITFPLPLTPSITLMNSALRWTNWLVTPLTGLGQVLFFAFLFLFPTGRFVPPWSRWLTLGAAGLASVAPIVPLPDLGGQWQGALIIAISLVMSAGGFVAQAYRYLRVSGPVERQQTKWVVFGVLATIVGLLICLFAFVAWGDNFALATAVFAVAVAFLLLIPASLAVSILRYRLWDIDLVIRRTLVYSTLTGALALAYFLSVILFQGLFRVLTGRSQNQFVTVISTLALAALFFPLRRRVQDVIDRRFYRKKYNAAKVIAEFAATCRDETDLERLTARLVEVVQETMQPESVSLWLKPTAPTGGRPRSAVETKREP